jgi:hypothetical protein
VPDKPILRIPAGAGQQASAMALTGPWPAGDDTGPGYYDTPAGKHLAPRQKGNHS